MKIKIITVGKIKEKYLRDGIDEYLKRLSKYTQIETYEVNDEKAPENLSLKDIEIVKDKEAERILSKIDKEYLIALDIVGKEMDSIQLSNTMNDIFSYHSSDIAFVIGGSLGLSNAILNKAQLRLSFSKLTFPHQLMKLILVEQIYRSFRILNNEPYHK